MGKIIGKTAIITGGSRGIGFAIALALAADGFNTVIVGRRERGDCAENLRKLEDRGKGVLYVQADVSAASGRERIMAGAVGAFGGVHVLVNNAGLAPEKRADLLEMSEESFDRVLGTNTRAVMFLTQLTARQMLKQPVEGKKRGTIINIGSCSAEVSSINRGEYCVSKAGLSMLTKLYAQRLAGEGIYVHEIRPGIIDTDMTGGVKEKYDALIAGGVFPIARWGAAEDVGKAAAVFASDAFLYTTGNYVDVDGGFHIRRL
ncbi:MAG: 3-ketoacyl-ACP reductase [Treponema sp.]|jgi:NAD(P)-dependent dehydrogenase (short-subunit alcohol dehydrogenase family)|nr:3-ketoacyl-ACP reductase [Treponema sp.]